MSKAAFLVGPIVVGALCGALAVRAAADDTAAASESSKNVRVAGIVLKWIRGDKEANLRRIEPLIREAAANGAKIVCTTECFLDGYAIADKSLPLADYLSRWPNRFPRAITSGTWPLSPTISTSTSSPAFTRSMRGNNTTRRF